MRATPNKAGFSLLEVVIASFVFVTTVVGLLSVWTAHARGISKARMVLVANELGEQKMEECVAARFQHVRELVTDPNNPPPPTRLEFIIKDRPVNAEFFTVVTVNPPPGGPSTTIVEVIVEVEWTDSTSTQVDERRSIRLITELHEQA